MREFMRNAMCSDLPAGVCDFWGCGACEALGMRWGSQGACCGWGAWGARAVFGSMASRLSVISGACDCECELAPCRDNYNSGLAHNQNEPRPLD